MEALLDGGGGSAAASGVGGEILTVQAGTFANLVAAHLWTCQTSQFVFRSAASAADGQDDDGEDGDGGGGGRGGGGGVGIDVAHDCLFREGTGALDGRVTYLPRTVVVELNGLQPKVQLHTPEHTCTRTQTPAAPPRTNSARAFLGLRGQAHGCMHSRL
jgi:hypothetical protein